MKFASKKNQVTVCHGSTCLTVVGDLARALALVVVIALAVQTAGQLARFLR